MHTMQEFQAVILAGGCGSRMFPLTEPGATAKPLIPVANRPLISYQLEMLESVGVKSAILLTNDDYVSEISNFLGQTYTGSVQLDIVVNEDKYAGTAESLLMVKDKIKRDFFVIAGDVICEGVNLNHVADIHRSEDAAVTVLLSKMKKGEKASQVALKQLRAANFNDYIGLDSTGTRLLLSSLADQPLRVKKALLRKFPNMTVYNDLVDTHVYLFSKWVIDFLASEQEINSIRTDLLPRLLRYQYKPAQGLPEAALSHFDSLEYTFTSSSLGSSERHIRCMAYVDNSNYCTRTNTTLSYVQANHDISSGNGRMYKPWEPVVNNMYFAHPDATVSSNALLGKDCIIGNESVVGTGLGDKSVIKKSVIGSHCRIADGVTINNSIIMHHVTIQKGCVISGCVISNSVSIGENSSLSGCLVGPACHVPQSHSTKNEIISKRE